MPFVAIVLAVIVAIVVTILVAIMAEKIVAIVGVTVVHSSSQWILAPAQNLPPTVLEARYCTYEKISLYHKK